MSRAVLLAPFITVGLSACWWNNGLPVTDSWDEDSALPESEDDFPQNGSSNFFRPDSWTLELWGFYDGERLIDFRYHSGNSGAVPAFAILRFTDHSQPEPECYWSGAVEIQGWTILEEDQYAAWGFTLELVDSTCRDFDREQWVATTPTTVLEGLYWTLGYRPPTVDLLSQLGRDHESPLDWADRYNDRAFTMQLGFERTQGTWEHFEAGAAYALQVTNGDVVVWDSWGRPYPQDVNEDIAQHVIVGATLNPMDPALLGVE